MSDTNPPQDQRHFTRIPFQTRVLLHCSDADRPSTLLDLSLKGALVRRPEDWNGSVGDNIRLELLLNERAVTINMETTVSHIEGDQIGLTSHRMDFESIVHLRRLVELNMADEEHFTRELSSLDD